MLLLSPQGQPQHGANDIPWNADAGRFMAIGLPDTAVKQQNQHRSVTAGIYAWSRAKGIWIAFQRVQEREKRTKSKEADSKRAWKHVGNQSSKSKHVSRLLLGQ